MIKKIAHIGIAVKSLDEQIPYYRDILGLELTGRDTADGGMLNLAFFKAGDVEIELLESADTSTPLAKFIEEKGQGIHHIAYDVDNCKTSLENVKAKGVTLIDENPRLGAGGASIGFLHPKSTFGVLTEFCEEPPKSDE